VTVIKKYSAKKSEGAVDPTGGKHVACETTGQDLKLPTLSQSLEKEIST